MNRSGEISIATSKQNVVSTNNEPVSISIDEAGFITLTNNDLLCTERGIFER